MTVKELKDYLATLPEDAQVITSLFDVTGQVVTHYSLDTKFDAEKNMVALVNGPAVPTP